jgi:hypothetical protein
LQEGLGVLALGAKVDDASAKAANDCDGMLLLRAGFEGTGCARGYDGQSEGGDLLDRRRAFRALTVMRKDHFGQ